MKYLFWVSPVFISFFTLTFSFHLIRPPFYMIPFWRSHLWPSFNNIGKIHPSNRKNIKSSSTLRGLLWQFMALSSLLKNNNMYATWIYDENKYPTWSVVKWLMTFPTYIMIWLSIFSLHFESLIVILLI